MDAKALVDILTPLIGRERLSLGIEMGNFNSFGNQAGKSTGKYAVLKDVRERADGLVELETEHEGRRWAGGRSWSSTQPWSSPSPGRRRPRSSEVSTCEEELRQEAPQAG